jgi:sugar lactone lactonase YvrE
MRSHADGRRYHGHLSSTGDYEHIPLPDTFTTNICFGLVDPATAFVTLSSTGRLLSIPWMRPGLKLNFNR